ncbi:MAG TPA: hypothetical protein VFP54_12050 [Acidimicrobiales bacterium]|nr:hypothetical protein [Acidimicrobiales bacterium]
MAGVELSCHHCQACEARWWSDEDGNEVDLTSVLELASLTRRRRRSS